MKNRTLRKPIHVVLLCILTGFIALQFFNKPLPQKPVTGRIREVPQPVEQILERSCYNCHSNEQQLSAFERIAPISWLVNKDIARAREVLNFSEWDRLSDAEQEGKFYAIFNMVKAGKMPLPTYALTHPDSKLSSGDVEIIKRYTLSLSTKKNAVPAVQTTVPLSPNGIAYNAEFKDWKVIGMSSLFDNSIRVIYANAIAVKAIEEDNFQPWPDGSTVAKAVFKQVKKANGTIVPGDFINVQYMVKDGTTYTDTEGWGFAKFSGPDLKPTGKTALFAKQSCISCHRQLAEATGFLFDVPPKVNSKQLIEHYLKTNRK